MAVARWVRTTLSTAAFAAAVLVAACTPEPKVGPVGVAPAVNLTPKIIEQASAYRAYMARASAIPSDFANGVAVADALKQGVAYEPQQFVQGAVAYGAIAALQDPAFVSGVRNYAHDAAQRRTIAASIARNPAYVLSFAGAASGAGVVTTALADDGRRVFEQGKLVKLAAYSVQRSPWSKAEVANRPVRLSLAKSLSSTPLVGDVAETFRLQQATSGGAPLGIAAATPSQPPYSPLVVRSLALAALAVLGEAGEANADALTSVMSEPTTGTCLRIAKLNVYQCLAVSKPHYEDVFCLGQHVMMDTGRCLIKGAGGPPPLEVLPAPLTVATAAPVAPAPAAPVKKR